MHVELVDEQVEHLVARRLGHLQAHGAVEAPAAQFHLDRFEEILGLVLLHRQVGVAGDPERRRLFDDHAGEEAVEVGDDDLLDGHEPAVTEFEQAGKNRRHLDPGEAPLTGLGIGDHRGDAQRQVGDVRERMAGIHRQRREDREDALLIDLAGPFALVMIEVGPPDDGDVGGGEGREQLVEEHPLLAGDQVTGPVVDFLELGGGGAPVGRRFLDARGDLVLERRHADLEELVEVARTDGAELGPLQERDPLLRGELQDAVVERQPAQLTVDEPVVHGGRQPSAVVRPAEIPLQRDGLPLAIAHDALPVAPELRVVAGQQHEPGQDAGAELVEHRAVAPVAVDLPVW